MNTEEFQIVSKLDSDIKLTKDITLSPFGTVEAKGIFKKTPNHYKRVNVVVDNFTEGCLSTPNLKTQIGQNSSDYMESIQ